MYAATNHQFDMIQGCDVLRRGCAAQELFHEGGPSMFLSRLTMNPVWRSLHDMQHEMNRLFDRWGNQAFGLVESPALNLWEENDALYLEAELPGLALEDLEIFVTSHNQLTLKGERK